MLILAAGGVLLALLVYLLVLAPMQSKLDQAQDSHRHWQDLQQWLQVNEPAIRAAAGKAGKSAAAAGMTGQALLTQVNRSAQMAGISLRRTEPEGEDKLRVWLEEAPFNAVMGWLVTLDRDMGIRVTNIAVDSSREPGLANFRIIVGATP
jgi:general secretion pathway protein M